MTDTLSPNGANGTRLSHAPGTPALDLVELAKPSDTPTPPDAIPEPEPYKPPHGLPMPGRREVVPPWLKDPKAAALWAVRHLVHLLKFYSVNVWIDLGKAALRTPRGVSRVVTGLARWAFDVEGAPLRRTAVKNNLFAEYRELDKRRREKAKARVPVALAVFVSGPLLAYAGVSAGGLVTLGTLLAGVLVFGWIGRNDGEPMLSPAVITSPSARKVTMDMVSEAIVAAGLARMPEQIRFFAQPHQRDGGWEWTLDLPPGKTFAEALKARDAIAGALDAKGVQLVLTEDNESQRRVHAWLSSGDPYVGEPIPHPLLRARSWSVWKAAPLGLNARRKRITVPLLFTGFLIGSLPRVGKTVLLRSLMVPWLMDPNARVIAIDGKGGNDMKPADRIAYRYISGVTPVAVQLVVQTVKELTVEVDRRNAVIQGLPIEDCPDGRLTPELAANPRLDMKPVGVFIDEVHRYLEHAVYGKTIAYDLKELAKVAPSVGISLFLSTQRPNAKTMDDGLRGSLGTRIALRTANMAVSKMILGDAAPGYDASKFGKRHKGVFIVVGADDSELAEEPPQILRGFHVTVQAFDGLCRRLHAERDTAGLLEGMAAGEQPVLSAEFQLLDDISAAFNGLGHDGKLWHSEIIEFIDSTFPERAGAWNVEVLGRACSNLKLPSRQINRTISGKRSNNRGVHLADLEKLLAERAEQIRLATVDADESEAQAAMQAEADDNPT